MMMQCAAKAPISAALKSGYVQSQNRAIVFAGDINKDDTKTDNVQITHQNKEADGANAKKEQSSTWRKKLGIAMLAMLPILTPVTSILSHPAQALEVDNAATLVVNQNQDRSSQIYHVAVSAPVVNRAEDIPLPAPGSNQHVIDLATPLLGSGTYRAVNAQLQQISKDNLAGNVYLVVIPGTSRNLDQLAGEILHHLSPDGKGSIIVMNAQTLINNRESVRHDSIILMPITINNTTTLIPVPTTNYILSNNMLSNAQGQHMFDNLADMLDQVESVVAQDADLMAQLNVLREDFQKNPQQVKQDIANWYAGWHQSEPGDEAYTIYTGNYNKVATDLTTEATFYYQAPKAYLQHMDHMLTGKHVLYALLAGTAILGGGFFVIKQFGDGY